jgi:cell division protein ZapA (FtsZ GTPase activity inhibitor)
MSSAPPGSLRSVKVQIAGQTLALRTDANAAYLRELAAFVTEKLGEVRDRHYGDVARRAVSTQALALLVALQLADELHQERAAGRTVRAEARARIEKILAHLDVLHPEQPQARAATPAGSRRKSRSSGAARRTRSRDGAVSTWR